MSKDIKPPVKSGWRGEINGYIESTNGTEINVFKVELKLDKNTAWAVCNLLDDKCLERESGYLEKDQKESLSNLGAALGRLIDHPSANNGGRKIIK